MESGGEVGRGARGGGGRLRGGGGRGGKGGGTGGESSSRRAFFRAI